MGRSNAKDSPFVSILRQNIKSDPPPSEDKKYLKITNIYVEMVNGQPKVIVEYEE